MLGKFKFCFLKHSGIFFQVFLICASWTCGTEPAGKGATGLILGMLVRTTATVLGDIQAIWISHGRHFIKSGHLNF